jgi:hypothetical protein
MGESNQEQQMKTRSGTIGMPYQGQSVLTTPKPRWRMVSLECEALVWAAARLLHARGELRVLTPALVEQQINPTVMEKK